jgi:hypothetical protein
MHGEAAEQGCCQLPLMGIQRLESNVLRRQSMLLEQYVYGELHSGVFA